MSMPKSSLNGNFPDNSNFQNSSTISQENLTRKVIQGKAIEGKSNALTAARDNLLYPNGESVGSTIMDSVVEPALKDLASNVVGSFFDIIVETINRMIFKDDPVRTPTSRYARGGRNQYVPFGSVFNNNSGYYNITPGYTGTHTGNQSMPAASPTIANRYNNIILENRGEAETFIDDLLWTVNQYQMISVANVYSKLDWVSSFQDTKWGWTPDTLNENTIVKRRISNGAWRIILPAPRPIDI